jgi:hypothetical protein
MTRFLSTTKRTGRTLFAVCWPSWYERRGFVEREPATREHVERFLRELGRRFRGAGRFYLVGGTQMVYAGFRRQTEDVDYMIQLEGDHQEFVSAVRSLIRELKLSVEPAHPGDFIPLPSGWEERSRYVGRYGRLDVFTFDPISTVLAKIERGASRDIEDALALVGRGLVHIPELSAAFEEIIPRLETESLRVDEADFRRKFEAFVALVEKRRHRGSSLPDRRR